MPRVKRKIEEPIVEIPAELQPEPVVVEPTPEVPKEEMKVIGSKTYRVIRGSDGTTKLELIG